MEGLLIERAGRGRRREVHDVTLSCKCIINASTSIGRKCGRCAGTEDAARRVELLEEKKVVALILVHRLDHHYAPNGFPVSNCRAGGVIIGGHRGEQGFKNTKKGTHFSESSTQLFFVSPRCLYSFFHLLLLSVSLPSTFTHALLSPLCLAQNL